MITPAGEARVQRITYLAEVRNRLLWPLDEPSAHPNANVNFTSTRFDRVLFINDIFFDPLQALQLMFTTNFNPTTNSADYRAACAADFVDPVTFYDTFVVRDSHGYGMGLQYFPWFPPTSDAESRNAVLAESDSVPVKSCWGGMVAYDAEEFLRQDVVHDAPNKARLSDYIKKQCEPLRFRSQPEIYWEESECCLINADLGGAHRPREPKDLPQPLCEGCLRRQNMVMASLSEADRTPLLHPTVLRKQNRVSRIQSSSPGDSWAKQYPAAMGIRRP